MFPEELDLLEAAWSILRSAAQRYRNNWIGQGDLVVTLTMTWEDDVYPLLAGVRVDNETLRRDFVELNEE